MFSNANQFQQTIMAFTRNLCQVNDKILNGMPNHDTKTALTETMTKNSPIAAIEFHSTEKSSTLSAVFNSDVTMDDGPAHEQQSGPWVSELADNSSDDASSESKSIECLGTHEGSRKRNFIDASITRRSTDNKKATRDRLVSTDKAVNMVMTSIEKVLLYVSRHQGKRRETYPAPNEGNISCQCSFIIRMYSRTKSRILI